MIKYIIIIIFFMFFLGCRTQRLALTEVIEKTDYVTDTLNGSVTSHVKSTIKTTTDYTTKPEIRQKERTKRKDIKAKKDSISIGKKAEISLEKEATKQAKEATRQTKIVNHITLWDKIKEGFYGTIIGLIVLFIINKVLWK